MKQYIGYYRHLIELEKTASGWEVAARLRDGRVVPAGRCATKATAVKAGKLAIARALGWPGKDAENKKNREGVER